MEQRPYLADGRRYSADLLVGADGIHSLVRAAVFADQAEPIPLGEGVWRGLIEGVQLHDVSMMFGGPVGTIGYTPLQGDTYLYVVDRDSNAPALDEPDVAARLIERIGKVPGFPANLLPHLSYRPGDVTYRPLASVWLPAPWYVGRIVDHRGRRACRPADIGARGGDGDRRRRRARPVSRRGVIPVRRSRSFHEAAL